MSASKFWSPTLGMGMLELAPESLTFTPDNGPPLAVQWSSSHTLRRIRHKHEPFASQLLQKHLAGECGEVGHCGLPGGRANEGAHEVTSGRR